MAHSAENYDKRNKIIQSQRKLGNVLDATIVNRLVHLFDKTSNDVSSKIISYIQDERRKRGLSDSMITVESEVYGYNTPSKSALFLLVKKNGKDFIHLTIHVAPDDLPKEHAGMIHIAKNIYKKKFIGDKQKKSYAMIYVTRPENKPNSLEFSIAEGYTTRGVKNSNLYNSEVQQEMDVFITVLNRMFDETNSEFYVGETTTSFNTVTDNTNNIYLQELSLDNNIHSTPAYKNGITSADLPKILPIHRFTNMVLKNMNRPMSKVTRKNKGKYLMPVLNNTHPSIRFNRRVIKRGTQRKPKNKK